MSRFASVFLLIAGCSMFAEALRHDPRKTLNALRNAPFFGSGPSSGCTSHPVPVPLTAAALSQLQPALAKADAAVNAAFTKSGVPGIAVGIVYNQTLLWSKGYGVTNLVNQSAPTPDSNTLYRIGSLSKIFADLATLQLRDRGMIELDDPIAKYVDFSMQNPWPLEKGITFRQLGSHMAGIPRSSPCNAIIGMCNFTTDDMFARFAAEAYIQPPNIQPSYSNAGFALLGHTLEAVVGEPYADYVVANVLKPLGMTSSGFDYTPDVVARMATGYINSLPNAPAPLYDLGWEAPAGQMYSSVTDLAKLASFMFSVDVTPYDTLDQATPAGPDVVNRTSLREGMLPTWVNDQGNAGFGLPWEMYNGGNFWLLTKGGDVLGYTASFVTVPAAKLAFIALSGSDAVDPIQFTTTALNAFMPAFEAVLTELQPAPALPSYVSELVAVYKGNVDPFTPIANVTLNSQTGVLHLELTLIAPFGLFPYLNADLSYDPVRQVFMTDAPADTCQSNQEGGSIQYVNFVRNSDGVWTVSVPGLLWVTMTQSP
eukprot:TRINITY_DN5816_c0_g1_i3.p1 TRINITY_DN5816_c0_g1~~TRINITY_DN5816_c0_g1_i3.p1  ORF type:complete len:540 (-),score=183.39 TRINITY_DN5816_c0_g1_i3:529-2148(-)